MILKTAKKEKGKPSRVVKFAWKPTVVEGNLVWLEYYEAVVTVIVSENREKIMLWSLPEKNVRFKRRLILVGAVLVVVILNAIIISLQS